MSIEIKDVTKDFKKVRALNTVNLTFEENKIYGLLGRNGAGKSTLLKIISNRIFSTEGEIFVDGVNARENDKALGKIYLMNESNLYPPKMKIKNIFINLMERGLGMKFMSSFPVFLTNDIALCALGKMNV